MEKVFEDFRNQQTRGNLRTLGSEEKDYGLVSTLGKMSMDNLDQPKPSIVNIELPRAKMVKHKIKKNKMIKYQRGIPINSKQLIEDIRQQYHSTKYSLKHERQ